LGGESHESSVKDYLVEFHASVSMWRFGFGGNGVRAFAQDWPSWRVRTGGASPQGPPSCSVRRWRACGQLSTKRAQPRNCSILSVLHTAALHSRRGRPGSPRMQSSMAV